MTWNTGLFYYLVLVFCSCSQLLFFIILYFITQVMFANPLTNSHQRWCRRHLKTSIVEQTLFHWIFIQIIQMNNKYSLYTQRVHLHNHTFIFEWTVHLTDWKIFKDFSSMRKSPLCPLQSYDQRKQKTESF